MEASRRLMAGTARSIIYATTERGGVRRQEDFGVSGVGMWSRVQNGGPLEER